MTHNLPDFTKYDEHKLEAARQALLLELDVRAKRAAIPAQLQQLAQQYVDSGGDLADLTLEQPARPEVQPLEVGPDPDTSVPPPTYAAGEQPEVAAEPVSEDDAPTDG